MHRTTIEKYTKLSAEELKKSANDPLSCVTEVQSNEILSLRPRDCGNIVKGVRRCVMDKIGLYHLKVNGIILGYAKIRIENTLSAFRADSPYLHVRATIDYYVFRPQIGLTLRGTVNYVSKAFVSAMIYQVFNVSVKLNGKANTHGAAVKKGSEITFIVKSCDMKNAIPIIDGELVLAPAVSIKQEQTTEDELETTIGEDQMDSGNIVVKKEPKTKKAKPSKKKVNASEESQPVTNGDHSPESGAHEKQSQVDKDHLIQSLLENMFPDMNEEPSASKKKKKKSKKETNSSKEQNRIGETIASNVSFDDEEETSHLNGTPTSSVSNGTSHSMKKRKVRFDLNASIAYIKQEEEEPTTESKQRKLNKK